MVSNEENVKKVEFLNKENSCLLSKISFVPGRDGFEYEKYLSNLEELFYLTGSSIHLINVCRAEKRMYGNFTPLAKKSAVRAFEKNRNEMGLYYALETGVSNLSINDSKLKLDEIFKKVKKNELKIIRNLYMAGIASREGDFLLSNKLIYDFKKNYSGKVLWQSNLLITEFDTGFKESGFLGNDDGDSIVLSEGESDFSPKYVISISCNEKYFNLYGDSFLSTIRVSCGSEAIIHISFVNMDKGLVESKMKILGKGLRVVAKFFYVDEEREVAVSAVTRIFVVNDILKNLNLPVFFCEIDGAIVKSLLPWVNRMKQDHIDHIVRVVGSVIPWRMYTCGFGGFLPTKSGFKVSKLISDYCKGVFNNIDRLVWADQSILEGAIRFNSLVDGGYKLGIPKLAEINDYIVTPTGSHEKKLAVLRGYGNPPTKPELTP